MDRGPDGPPAPAVRPDARPVAPDAIGMLDLAAQRRRLGGRIEAAIGRVLAHGQFVMGPEVEALEARLARHAGVRHAIGCASGTDALLLILLAGGVGAGDAVFLPAFTFVAPAEVVALLGATPVLVDVDPVDFAIDPASLDRALDLVAGRPDLRPRAIVAVDLFGQPARYDALRPIARSRRLMLVQDAAQSFGARLDGVSVGAQADAAATSFYPSKPLGGYGDGGAVLTDDDRLAEQVCLARVHGAPRGRPYEHRRIGLNARLDTLQAAVVLTKLEVLDEELASRRALAERYDAGLDGCVHVPRLRPGVESSWAQYTIRHADRDHLATGLAREGIASAVHYPRPLHALAPYCGALRAPGGLPVAEALAATVLSLPLHPDLDHARQDRVIAAVRRVSGEKAP